MANIFMFFMMLFGGGCNGESKVVLTPVGQYGYMFSVVCVASPSTPRHKGSGR